MTKELRRLMMKRYNISDADKIVEKTKYGGKAYWLSWMINNGYKVPKSFFLPAVRIEEINELISFLTKSRKFQKIIHEFKTEDSLYDIAIRSSAIYEDSIDKSYAGHFKSFIDKIPYEQVLHDIEKVIRSLDNYQSHGNSKMGVVLQKKINAKYSGVIFSSNPLNASKKEVVITVSEGMGEQLVSGKISGETIIVKYNNKKQNFPTYNSRIDNRKLKELINRVKEIEKKLKLPIDVEWCINEKNNQLYLLQCRPITGISNKKSAIVPIDFKNEALIPLNVRGNNKVQLRLLAQQNDIDISKAYLVLNNGISAFEEIELLRKIVPEERSKGYSIVLIFPETISGNIIRHFARKEFARHKYNLRNCQRYALRTYYDYFDLYCMLRKIQSKCSAESWICTTIIQEILEPEFTGIAKKIDDGVILEVAKGHFIPKGIVATSQYIINDKGELLFKKEVKQEFLFKIIKGKVLRQNIDSIVSIDDKNLAKIAEKLKPILIKNKGAVEFGLLEDKSIRSLNPYLIDLVEDQNKHELNIQLIKEGVISKGIRFGSTKILDNSFSNTNSLNLHFHNKITEENISDENIIFIANTPDIALLELIKHYDNTKIGFVFKEGSLLSHFSIILREKEIPAVVINHEIKINDMEKLKIDASTPNLRPHQRISKEEGNVTTYINPDTDGICTSLAFSFYSEQFVRHFKPVFFGNLDEESKFVLNYFKVDFPSQIDFINEFDKIVLIDTHHVEQLPKEFPFEKVIEIIDHHPGGNPDRFPNAVLLNEKVGAACTILSEMMKRDSILPDKKIAGIMAMAIISNTLNFTAPSTSERDHEAFEWLNTFNNISTELIIDMFKARSNVSSIPTEKILVDGLKTFTFGSAKVGISQVEMYDIKSIVTRKDFIYSLKNIKEVQNLNYIIFSGVNILERTTTIVCPDKQTSKVISEGMKIQLRNEITVTNNILLRKTHYIPLLEKYFKNT